MASIQQTFIDGVIEMVKIYDKYLQSGGNLGPKEFAKSNFCEKKLFINEKKEEYFRVFFEICSQKSFLKAICDDILSLSGPVELVHIYLLLCFLTTVNANTVFGSILKYFKGKQREDIIQYFTKAEAKQMIKIKVYELFDNSNNRINIVKEFNERVKLLLSLGPLLENKMREENAKSNYFITKYGYRLLTELNSAKDVTNCAVPNGSLTSIETKSSPKIKSGKQSKRIITAPSSNNFSLKSRCSLESESKVSNISKLSNEDRIPTIKQTVTQVLREQARIKKKAEDAEKLLKDISRGSRDPYKISAMLEELKMEESENQLQEIERKHLLGRISQEEARLSRLAVQKTNQIRAATLKEQKHELELKLAEYKKEEEARMKEMIEKVHNLECVKQAQTNLLNQKKQVAKEVQNQSRQMRLLIVERKQEELNHKIALIRQIKELEQASKATFNKETNYKSSGIGESCSMTLEELREALLKIRKEVQQELEERRKKVQEEKLRQRALIQDAKKTIERYKNVPKKSLSAMKVRPELRVTPEIIRLRRKLKQRKAQADQLRVQR